MSDLVDLFTICENDCILFPLWLLILICMRPAIDSLQKLKMGLLA